MRHTYVNLLVISLLLTGGCLGVLESPQPTPLPPDEELPYLHIYTDDVIRNQSGYYFRSRLVAYLPPGNMTLPNTMLCVYDDENTLQQAVSVGTLGGSNYSVASFNLTISDYPADVIPYHPALKDRPHLILQSISIDSNSSWSRPRLAMGFREEVYPYNTEIPAGECA